MITAFGKRVLIEKIDEVQDKVVDGVVIPKSAQGDGLARGKVIDFGDVSNLHTGDVIIFTGNCRRVMDGESTYYLVDENEILGIQ